MYHTIIGHKRMLLVKVFHKNWELNDRLTKKVEKIKIEKVKPLNPSCSSSVVLFNWMYT